MNSVRVDSRPMSIESFWDVLSDCTAHLNFRHGEHGTGTVVGEHLVVTCAHVLNRDLTDLKVTINKVEFEWEVFNLGVSPFPDVAVLRLLKPARCWVQMDSDVAPGDNVYAFGYPDDYPSGESLTGEIEGWTNLEAGANLKIKGGQVRPGMSGAALFNMRTFSVCGIVRTTRDRNADLGGRAIPSSEVDRVLQAVAGPRPTKVSPAWRRAVAGLQRGSVEVSVGDVGAFAHESTTRPLHGSLEPAEFFCGREAELEKVGDFIDRDDAFVLAISGIGGSGKTAIVREFLDREELLTRPAGAESTRLVFAWSFYDFPSTSDFLRAAVDRFSVNRVGEAAATVDRLLDAIIGTQGLVILVLDGMEKMQAPGNSGFAARGSVEDPAMRQFLLAIADGEVRNCRVIITTRFPMTDFAARRASGYLELPIDDLGRSAAIDLLERIGVANPVEALERGYGQHALTLDLLGRFVRVFFDGRVPPIDVLPSIRSSGGMPDIDKQASRLLRVLSAYSGYLSSIEAELIRWVSLFRRPVKMAFLSELMQLRSSGEGESAGMNINQQSLRVAVRRLENLRLIWLDTSQAKNWSVTSHPAVRDYFYSTIGDASRLHETVETGLLSLVDRPGRGSDVGSVELDLIEELMYHTMMLGRSEDAFQIYRERLGYLRLGWQSGDHARGVNVLSMVTNGRVGSTDLRWSPDQTARVTIDYALYLKNLGALDEASDVLLSISDDVRRESGLEPLPRADVALALQNLSAVLLLQGQLPRAEAVARDGLELALALGDQRLEHDSRVRLGTALSLLGEAEEAESELRRAMELPLDADLVVRDVASVRLGSLLRRTSRLEEALEITASGRRAIAGRDYGIIVARLDIVEADVLVDLGRLGDASPLVERVRSWVTHGADIEMTIAANLTQARLFRSAGDPDAAILQSDRAIRLARRHGYLLYLYDSLIVRGFAGLDAGDSFSASESAREVLEGSEFDGAVTLGASDASILYRWAIDDAGELLTASSTG